MELPFFIALHVVLLYFTKSFVLAHEFSSFRSSYSFPCPAQGKWGERVAVGMLSCCLGSTHNTGPVLNTALHVLGFGSLLPCEQSAFIFEEIFVGPEKLGVL